MRLYDKARTLVTEAAMGVARGRRQAAEEVIRAALEETQTEAEPRLKELETEVDKLRKALAYHYFPRREEMICWYSHCDEVLAAGGTPPPAEDDWWVDIALDKWELEA